LHSLALSTLVSEQGGLPLASFLESANVVSSLPPVSGSQSVDS
jgi:hypothetical protein